MLKVFFFPHLTFLCFLHSFIKCYANLFKSPINRLFSDQLLISAVCRIRDSDRVNCYSTRQTDKYKESVRRYESDQPLISAVCRIKDSTFDNRLILSLRVKPINKKNRLDAALSNFVYYETQAAISVIFNLVFSMISNLKVAPCPPEEPF